MWSILAGLCVSFLFIFYEMYNAPYGEETEKGFRETDKPKK